MFPRWSYGGARDPGPPSGDFFRKKGSPFGALFYLKVPFSSKKYAIWGNRDDTLDLSHSPWVLIHRFSYEVYYLMWDVKKLLSGGSPAAPNTDPAEPPLEPAGSHLEPVAPAVDPPVDPLLYVGRSVDPSVARPVDRHADHVLFHCVLDGSGDPAVCLSPHLS